MELITYLLALGLLFCLQYAYRQHRAMKRLMARLHDAQAEIVRLEVKANRFIEDLNDALEVKQHELLNVRQRSDV